MAIIRRARLQDLPAIYRVCHFTSDPSWPEGLPERNPDLLGHVYAGPYVVGARDYAAVIADSAGVSGYILGCPDTVAFSRWCEEYWWPALREQHPLESGQAADSWILNEMHSGVPQPAAVLEHYPAHLHIDILPELQGTGAGRRLMEWLLSRFREAGVPGVHLGVSPLNTNAIGFYLHLGFEIFPTADDTMIMVKRISSPVRGK